MCGLNYQKSHPIFNAAVNHQYKRVKEMVRDGCDLNNTLSVQKWGESKTALKLLIECYVGGDNIKMIKLLLRLGADVTHQSGESGDNALTWCAKHGNAEVFDFLVAVLGKKFDINVKNGLGDTPLILSTVKVREDLVECILKYKPQLELEGHDGKNALEMAQTYVSYRAQMLTLLESAYHKDKIEKIEQEKKLLHGNLTPNAICTKKKTHKL